MAVPIPEARADQLLPFHLAIPSTADPPAALKPPPAYRTLPDTAKAFTPQEFPSIPELRADQLLPFHLAMPEAEVPPAVSKAPPAYSTLPDTASADTGPFQ